MPCCCVVRPRLCRVWALPGGFIHTGEDADAKASAARVLRTKVGIEGAYLEQLATFSGPARDPRGWSVAIAYCALLPVQNLPPDRADISVVPLSALPQLPFDHRAILDAALERVRSKACIPPCPFTCVAKPSRCRSCSRSMKTFWASR